MAPKPSTSQKPSAPMRASRRNQDIDEDHDGSSSGDSSNRGRKTGKKHKRSGPAKSRKKARAQSSNVEVVDACHGDDSVEEVDDADGVGDENGAPDSIKHIPGAELKPVKNDSTRDLHTIFTIKGKARFKTGVDKDGETIYGPTKVGRWCKICKEDPAVLESKNGLASAFFTGGNSTCRQHCRKHWAEYKSRCESATPKIKLNERCMPPEVKAALDSEKSTGAKEEKLDQGFLLVNRPLDFSRELELELVAKFIAVDDQAIMVAGKPVFRNVLVGMRPKTRDEDLPSPHDVEVFIHNSFVERIKQLKADIKKAPGKVHGTTDCWSQDLTSAAFLGSTAHWIEVLETEWRMRSEVIAFRGLSGEHTGYNLARHLLGIFECVGIYSKTESKLGNITADNASNNSTMASTIEETHISHGRLDWDADEALLGCLGHVIELAIEAVVTTMTKKTAVETTTAIWEFDPTSDHSLLDGGKADVAAMLRTLSVKINASSQRKEYFESCQETAKIDNAPLVIPLHSNIRWGSLHSTLSQSSKLRRAISLFVNSADEQFGPITTLRKDGKVVKSIPWSAFKIPEDRWAEVDLLCGVLHDARAIQQIFSSEKVPTLWQVIPQLEDLMEKWEAKRADPTYSALATAIDAGLDKLAKYHMIYVEKKPAAVLSLVMHPYYKMDYIVHKWDGAEEQQELHSQGDKDAVNWQSRAMLIFEEAVQERWDAAQKEKSGSSTGNTAEMLAPSASVRSEVPPAHESDFDRRRRERAAVAPQTEQSEDWRMEIRRYLGRLEDVKKDVNLVEWWFEHRNNYPTLARLAIDILSIPASSVACERLFSAAKEIATHKRSRLGSERFEQLQMMKFAWRGTIFDFAKLNSSEVEEVEMMVREFEELETMSTF